MSEREKVAALFEEHARWYEDRIAEADANPGTRQSVEQLEWRRAKAEGFRAAAAALRAAPASRTEETPAPAHPGSEAEALVDAFGTACDAAGLCARCAEGTCDSDHGWNATRDALLAHIAQVERRAEKADSERDEAAKLAGIPGWRVEQLDKDLRRLREAESECERLRAVGQAVVDAYRACRDRNSMSGFWTHLDDLAAELDGRADAARRSDAERRAALSGGDGKETKP